MSALIDKFKISGLAVVPYVIVLVIVLLVVYTRIKRPILNSPWMDALIWGVSIILFYFVSFGFMYIPIQLNK